MDSPVLSRNHPVVSAYSIDSGNKLITDALAEGDIVGIFGFQGALPV